MMYMPHKDEHFTQGHDDATHEESRISLNEWRWIHAVD